MDKTKEGINAIQDHGRSTSWIFFVDEECLGIVVADDAHKALQKYAEMYRNVQWVEGWGCFVIGHARKIFAQEV